MASADHPRHRRAESPRHCWPAQLLRQRRHPL